MDGMLIVGILTFSVGCRRVFTTKTFGNRFKIKIRVLLAQSLFGNPDILIMDEPTNNWILKP